MKKGNLKLLRYAENKANGGSTTGLLFLNNIFLCYTLEDESREQKIKGETRIPEGVYRVSKFEQETPLTLKYRERFGFFDFHYQIEDVPNFDSVYLHCGNKESHTDGCILVGDSINNNQIESAFLGNSTGAYQRLYKALEGYNEITINILNV